MYTTYLNKNTLSDHDLTALAKIWRQGMYHLAHSELLQFPKLKSHDGYNTDSLLNDCFIELWQRWHQVSGTSQSFYAYCRSMMRNNLLDLSRKINAEKRRGYTNRVALSPKQNEVDARLQHENDQRERCVDFVIGKMEELMKINEDQGVVLHETFFLYSSLRDIEVNTRIQKDAAADLLKHALHWLECQAEDEPWLRSMWYTE